LINTLAEYIGKPDRSADRSAGGNSRAVVTWGDDEGMITTFYTDGIVAFYEQSYDFVFKL
jgi:hypothetical protein